MKLSVSILDAVDKLKSVELLNHTDISYIHVDVMDGKFVPKVSFFDVKEVRKIDFSSNKKLDIHLMVEHPMEYLEKLLKDKSCRHIEYITFHLEIKDDIEKVIHYIKDRGYKVGLAIKPDSNVWAIEKYLSMIDMVLVMGVEPGYGGQKFMISTSDKMKEVMDCIGNRNVLIEVDGGITDQSINYVKGADIVVSGSYVVKSDDYELSIFKLINHI